MRSEYRFSIVELLLLRAMLVVLVEMIGALPPMAFSMSFKDNRFGEIWGEILDDVLCVFSISSHGEAIGMIKPLSLACANEGNPIRKVINKYAIRMNSRSML